MLNSDNKKWDLIIKPQKIFFDLSLGELTQYRDLVRFLVRRAIESPACDATGPFRHRQ